MEKSTGSKLANEKLVQLSSKWIPFSTYRARLFNTNDVVS